MSSNESYISNIERRTGWDSTAPLLLVQQSDGPYLTSGGHSRRRCWSGLSYLLEGEAGGEGLDCGRLASRV
jgi:hypothetical protein